MDGILNAYHRSMNPFYSKSFEEKFQHFIAYPKTHNIDKKDFDAPTCYYSCDDKGCDFSECTQKINQISFLNHNIQKFSKEVIEKHSKCLPIADNMDGLIISYTPEKLEISKSVLCIMNKKTTIPVETKDSEQLQKARIGVFELNEDRLKIMNS
jgi:hypothetical protein